MNGGTPLCTSNHFDIFTSYSDICLLLVTQRLSYVHHMWWIRYVSHSVQHFLMLITVEVEVLIVVYKTSIHSTALIFERWVLC